MSSGLGLDLFDLVDLGIDLIKDPLAFGADLFQDILGEALDQVRGVLGDIIDVLGDFGALLAVAWDALKEIPWLGQYLAFAEAAFKNFLDMLWYRLTGQLASISDPGVGNVSCPGSLPSVSGELDYPEFLLLPAGSEIGREIAWLLDALLPTIYQFSDDAPPLTITGFEKHAELVAGSPAKWDVYDSFRSSIDAQWREAGPPYAKAWKIGDRRILVEIGMLRAVSFWACSRADSELAYEHEGDGERLYVHLQVDPTDENDPASSERADVRLTGIVGTGHEETHPYSWKKLHVVGGRATAGVGRGTHATSIAIGPAAAGDQKWYNALNADYFPGPDTRGATSVGMPVVETGAAELRSLYEQDAPGVKADDRVHWGGHRAVGKTYPAWKRGSDLSAGNLASWFPLDPAESGACKFGSPCPSCPTVLSYGEGTTQPDDATNLSDKRPSQTLNRLKYPATSAATESEPSLS